MQGDPSSRRSSWRKWDWKSWVIAAFGALALAWFLIWGPVGLAEIPADPTFCLGCHNMQLEYDSWHVSAHNAQICGDCHLPAEPVSRLFWDAVFGIRDIWKFRVVGEWDEPIRAKPRTQAFVQENCIRCHGAKVHAAISDERFCWECHREFYHRNQLWKDEQASRRYDDPRN
jgi:cytochrome c nitrite reductase small subunit